MYDLNFEDVLCELKEGIATLVINREDKLNSLNTSVLDHMYRYLTELENDEAVKVIVITGSGDKAFAAGADLAEIYKKSNIEQYRNYYAKFDLVYEMISSIPQPVIAKVNGYAFGGGALMAFSCDMVVASKKSTFSQPEVDFGFTGGATLLPKLVGRHLASEITLLGRPFSAEDGYRWNLINRVVEEKDLDFEVEKICRLLLGKSPIALSMIKKCIKNSYDVGLMAGNRFETEASTICLNTQESKDKIENFIKKVRK